MTKPKAVNQIYMDSKRCCACCKSPRSAVDGKFVVSASGLRHKWVCDDCIKRHSHQCDAEIFRTI